MPTSQQSTRNWILPTITRVSLEVDHSPVKPWNDCSPGQHLDYSQCETLKQSTQLNHNPVPGPHKLCNHKCVLFKTPFGNNFLYSKKYLTHCELQVIWGFPHGSNGKESACNAGDHGSVPGWGRSHREGNGYPLQYSCLENSMDRGAWRATAHGVAKRKAQLSNNHYIINMLW